MRIYAIGDLHLPGGADKPMNVFGSQWEGHFSRISADWRERVTPEDTVLIPGDISWAMQPADALPDLRAIAALPGSMTVFIVSQRAASVRRADLILVLDDGRLVGSGTHDQLMASCPVYREIYYSQFPEEKNPRKPAGQKSAPAAAPQATQTPAARQGREALA